MKKILFIITALVGIASQPASAQQNNCQENESVTNPSNPSDLRGQPYINEVTPGVPKFDWRSNYYDFYKLAPNSSVNYIPDAMINPFWDPHNPITKHLAHDLEIFRDYQHEDGWELLIFNMGVKYNYDNQQLVDIKQDIQHPYFALYNKFTGILRIFVYFDHSKKPGYNSGYITIYPEDISGNQAAVYSHFEVNTRPLVAFNKSPDIQSTFINADLELKDQQWMYADFAMSYDPCVCFFEYNRIYFDVWVIDDAQLEFDGFINAISTGSLDLDITGKIKGAGGGSNNPVMQSIAKADKAGQTMFKVAKNVKTLIESAAINGLSGSDKAEMIQKLSKSKLLKNIPYIGQAIGILDFLVGGSEKTTFHGTAKGNIALTTSGEIKLTGDISKDDNVLLKRGIYVPGSKIINPQLYNEVPVYNEPLGVFMMLEPPLIKYVEYREFYRPNMVPKKFRQYKVDELPIFKLNPSSGLEIEEMKVSLVLDYGIQQNNVPGEFNVNSLNFTTDHNHPVFFSESAPTNLVYQPQPYIEYEKMGFNLEKEILSSGGAPESVRLTLGQIPIGCFENTSFCLISDANHSEELVLKLRFNLILKEKLTGMLHQAIHIYNIPSSYIIPDEGDDGSLRYFSETPIDPSHWDEETGSRNIIPFSNSVFSSPNSSLPSVPSFYPEKNTNILDYLIFEDEIIPEGTYKAWELISLGDNVTLQGNSSFYSYGEIFMTPENQFTPEKKFSTIFPDAGCYDNPMDYNTEDVSSFCENNNKYKPYRHKTEPDLDIDTTPIVKSFDFKLYPNPTSRIVNVELPEMAEGGVYDITVMDIRGQVMSEMRILPSETVGSVYEMEVSHLTAGIYFVRLVIDGEAKVKRLVIL